MSDPGHTPTGRIRRIWSILPPGHWAYLLILLVPTAIVDLLFSTWRLAMPAGGIPITPGSLAWLASIRSDLFFHLANIAFWVGVFAVVRQRFLRALATLVFHLWFTALAIFIVVAQLYFVMLDVVLTADSWNLVALLFQVQMLKIIQAEMKSFVPLSAVVLIILGNLLPVVLNRRWKPRWLHRLPTDEANPPKRTAVALGAAVAVVACLGLSALPDGRGTTQFTQNREVNLTGAAVVRSLGVQPAGFRRPQPSDLQPDFRLTTTARTKKLNVVELVLESQSWHSTTLANPRLKTTPFLAKIAPKALVADRAFTVVPHTTKSLVGSQCGLAPPLDTENSEAVPGGIGGRCLPTLLDEQGYATAFFQTATQDFERRKNVVKNFGFREFHPLESFNTKGFSPTNTLGYEDDVMPQPSLDWAEKHRKKPFAMTYMTLTAHTKYVLPRGYKVRHYVDDVEHNQYLNAVRYQDDFVRDVIEGFERRGLANNTIFVIMGDHGEGFREHGRRLHNDTIWNEGTRIPMVIYAPGIPGIAGKRITTAVVNAAIPPTLVDLLGFRAVNGRFEHRSILAGPARPFHVSCWNPNQCTALIYPRAGRKYIYFYGQRPSEWFDLRSDPNERHNEIANLSERRRHRIERGIEKWTAEVDARHALSRGLAASATG